MAKLKTYKFDAADYLKDEKDIAAYLNAVLEDYGDDAAFIAKALGTVARARGMSKVARKAKMSRESLYRALSGKGNPEFATIIKVANALGVQFRVT